MNLCCVFCESYEFPIPNIKPAKVTDSTTDLKAQKLCITLFFLLVPMQFGIGRLYYKFNLRYSCKKEIGGIVLLICKNFAWKITP